MTLTQIILDIASSGPSSSAYKKACLELIHTLGMADSTIVSPFRYTTDAPKFAVIHMPNDDDVRLHLYESAADIAHSYDSTVARVYEMIRRNELPGRGKFRDRRVVRLK